MSTESNAEIQALIQRAVSENDAVAFERLVVIHQSRLRYSLRQLTGWDEALADDIAQDTFLRAYQSLAKFKGESTFITWLYRIAYNEFVNQHRKIKVSGCVDTEAEHDVADPGVGNEPNQDLHRDLARAMLALTVPQRAALHLTLHREYTQAEVADIMGLPMGTVKSHILRGRGKLQHALAAWREELSH